MDINQLIENKTILQSNTSGPFIITKNLGIINKRNRVLIKFINTGYEYDVIAYNALDGRVMDKTLNCISNDYDINRYINYENHINNILRTIYSHMIDRCYNTNSQKYSSYGAIGIKVCDKWLQNINTFIDDAKIIDQYNKFYNRPYAYQLDKDYKQIHLPKNQRIYSKNTCIFLSNQDNINIKCIDNKNNGLTKYFGVEINSAGNFYARIKINNVRYNIGTFNNEIAAANAYNYWSMYYHNYELVPLYNDVPYMAPNEFIKYNVNPKELCGIIQ